MLAFFAVGREIETNRNNEIIVGINIHLSVSAPPRLWAHA